VLIFPISGNDAKFSYDLFKILQFSMQNLHVYLYRRWKLCFLNWELDSYKKTWTIENTLHTCKKCLRSSIFGHCVYTCQKYRRENPNFGAQNVVKIDKCMGDSQNIGGGAPGLAPQSLRLSLRAPLWSTSHQSNFHFSEPSFSSIQHLLPLRFCHQSHLESHSDSYHQTRFHL